MKKTLLAKNIVGLALLIITGILAAATIYFNAFIPLFKEVKTWTSDDYALIGVITLILGPLLILFLSPAFFIIWDYIGEKYGKKQHLLNACWLVLSCAFAYFTFCFPNVLIKTGQLSAISEVSLQLYHLAILFVTLFLLCWLCHLVDYCKHLLEYIQTPMIKTHKNKKNIEKTVQNILEELKKNYPSYDISYHLTKQRGKRYLFIVKGFYSAGSIDVWSADVVYPILLRMVDILEKYEDGCRCIRLLFIRNNQFILHSPDVGTGNAFAEFDKYHKVDVYGYHEYQSYVGECRKIEEIIEYLTNTTRWF